MRKALIWARSISIKIIKATYETLKEPLIFLFLFVGSLLLMFVASGFGYSKASTTLPLQGIFWSTIALILASYVCLGLLVFREDNRVRKIFMTAAFVLFFFPVMFGFAFHENQCVSQLNTYDDYMILSYAVFTGSGPAVTDVNGVCRISIILASLCAYIGLALLFAVLSSIFTPTDK